MTDNRLEPEQQDLDEAARLMAQPEKLKAVLPSLFSIAGEPVPLNPDQRTIAIALGGLRRLLEAIFPKLKSR